MSKTTIFYAQHSFSWRQIYFRFSISLIIIIIIIIFFNFEDVNEMKTIFLALSDLDALAKISNPGQIVRVGCKTRD